MWQLWRRYGIGFGGALLWLLAWLVVVDPVLGGLDPRLVEPAGVPGPTDWTVPVAQPYSLSLLAGGGLYLLLVVTSDAVSLAVSGRADDEAQAPRAGDLEG